MNYKSDKVRELLSEYKEADLKKRKEIANDLAAKLGTTTKYIEKVFRLELRKTDKTKKEKDIPELIAQDREERKSNIKLRLVKNKYDHLLKEYETLEERLNFMLDLKQQVEEIPIIKKPESGIKNVATPIILLSDWHFEERVDADTINGLNEYNLEIAKKRWFDCIQNSQKLVQHDRSHSKINNLVLWLGGDFITGYIHEELMESNYLSPTEATLFAKSRIIEAIKFYLQYGDYQTIDIICNFGNHGRTEQKKKISTGYKNSYEFMMYCDIKEYFKDESRIKFTIQKGYFAYINIYDFVCRFWHGDTIKYGGGIGGLTVPLIKAIHRYNGQINADYNFIGHYHQLFQATKDCMVNGSGIGFNAYAQNIGASPEQPLQGYCLIDAKYGMTIKAPIRCV